MILPNETRIAKLETAYEGMRAEMDALIKADYEKAVAAGDAELAAELARKIRNKMLEASDSRVALDRIGLDTSSTTKFLASLAGIFKGDWAVYRQALRDLTAQEGFPFNIDWPVDPESAEAHD